MKHKPDINQVFNSIKNMPVEIDISGIEKFVLAQPATVFTLKTLFSTTKIIFMTTGIATIITTAVILFSLDNNKSSATYQDIPVLKKEIRPEQPLTMLNFDDNNLAINVLPELPETVIPSTMPADTNKRKTTVTVSSGNGYSMSSTTIENPSDSNDVITNTYSFSTSNNGSVGTTSGKNSNKNSSSSSSSNSGSNTSSTAGNIFCDSNGVQVFATYDCDKQETFQKVIEDELIADGLIKSGKRYVYTISDKSFSVGNNKQSNDLRKKYTQLLLDYSCYQFGRSFQFMYSKAGDSISISTSSGD
ncbi:MAG: hypothetical protein WAT43_11140 [Chitinophagales bacterium]